MALNPMAMKSVSFQLDWVGVTTNILGEMRFLRCPSSIWPFAGDRVSIQS